MLFLLQLNTLFFLFFIFWEDQRHLALPVWVFFPLALNWLGVSFFQANWLDWLTHGLLNSLCVSLALSLLYVYAKKRFGEFINKAFGLGDVLFLFLFAWAYPTPTFILLWVGGTITSLVLARFLKKTKVPYAGNLAVFNAVALLTQLFPQSVVNLYDYYAY